MFFIFSSSILINFSFKGLLFSLDSNDLIYIFLYVSKASFANILKGLLSLK